MRRLVVTMLFALSVFGPSMCFAQPAKNLIPAYQAISTPDFGYLPTYVARAKGFFTDERLDANVPGRTYNFYRLFQSTTQHAVYHAGQIALLKKLS